MTIVDSKTTPLPSLDARLRCHTVSGVHVREISEAIAKTFLSRQSAPVLQATRLALGAFEDNGALVGVLAVTGSPSGIATIHVVIAPERRRLKIATDLFQTLVTDHVERIGQPLKFCNSIEAGTAQALRDSIEPRASRAVLPRRN